MPTEPTFYVFDAGDFFSKHRENYIQILGMQEKIHALQRKVHALVFQTQERVAEIVAKPEITAEHKAEAEGLLVQAAALRDSADAQVTHIDRIRLTMLRDTVDEIGRTLQQLKAWRSEIELGEAGIESAGFDRILADLEARYKGVYRPMFPLTKLPGAVAQVPNPSAWTEQEWEKIHTNLDGPLILWDVQECIANWKIPGINPCEGPDYFHTLSMINQIFVAKQNQIDIIEEFPIISALDMMFFGGDFEEYDEELKKAEEALAAAEETVGDILKTLAAILKGIRKAAETFAKAPVLLIAGGLVAIMLLRKK